MLSYIDMMCRKYDNVQVAILRREFSSVVNTIQQSFEKLIINGDSSIMPHGGGKVSWFDYPNGSRIWLGGMDKPDKILGGELDIIFANQVEQFKLNGWEYLTTRATGRAGHIPNPQVIGDCNPAGSRHWILTRQNTTLLKSFHEDNPLLFDDDGNATEQGNRTLGILDKLTGARLLRLRHGQWAQSEGVVFGDEFSEENITENEPDPALPVELAADDGYHPDPRVILFIQQTPTSVLVYDEMYHNRHLAEKCVGEVIVRCGEKFGWLDAVTREPVTVDGDTDMTTVRPMNMPELCVGGSESKELRGRFLRADIPYRGGTHRILQGIEVMRRLFLDANGYRMIKVHKRCVNFIGELTDGYKYPDTESKTRKLDEPVDEDNHGPDAFRYWAWKRLRR